MSKVSSHILIWYLKCNYVCGLKLLAYMEKRLAGNVGNQTFSVVLLLLLL